MSDIIDKKPHNNSDSQLSGGAANHSDACNLSFFQCTQEDNENNIDVVWDWNSPQSKPRTRKQKKKEVRQSPKLPIKRHSSNNQISSFNRLKEELQTLRDHIVESTDTSAVSNIKRPANKFNVNAEDLEDLFNDSMEEQILVCSQEAEKRCATSNQRILKNPMSTFQESIKKESTSKTSVFQMNHNNNEVKETVNNFNVNIKNNSDKSSSTSFLRNENTNRIADDSFDFILETLQEEDLEINNPSTPALETTGILKSKEPPIDDSFKCTAQEIEKKRKQAILKLGEKKRHLTSEVTTLNCTIQSTEQNRKETLSKIPVNQKEATYEHESPVKCSPEEIEQKRLQALAKLEAKKKQDIIERNRLQALKRLEENKRKRALYAKTTLPQKTYNPNI